MMSIFHVAVLYVVYVLDGAKFSLTTDIYAQI